MKINFRSCFRAAGATMLTQSRVVLHRPPYARPMVPLGARFHGRIALAADLLVATHGSSAALKTAKKQSRAGLPHRQGKKPGAGRAPGA